MGLIFDILREEVRINKFDKKFEKIGLPDEIVDFYRSDYMLRELSLQKVGLLFDIVKTSIGSDSFGVKSLVKKFKLKHDSSSSVTRKEYDFALSFGSGFRPRILLENIAQSDRLHSAFVLYGDEARLLYGDEKISLNELYKGFDSLLLNNASSLIAPMVKTKTSVESMNPLMLAYGIYNGCSFDKKGFEGLVREDWGDIDGFLSQYYKSDLNEDYVHKLLRFDN